MMRYLYILCCVVRLCWPVRGPGFTVRGCDPAGIMVVLALCVPAEPMVIPGRRAITSGCTRARRVMAEPRVVCPRR